MISLFGIEEILYKNEWNSTVERWKYIFFHKLNPKYVETCTDLDRRGLGGVGLK